MSVPHFPRAEEPWLDCHICGFSFPRSHLTKHYRSKRWVCRQDADVRTHADNMADLILPPDRPRPSEQPVAGQGGVTSSGFGDFPFGTWAFGV